MRHFKNIFFIIFGVFFVLVFAQHAYSVFLRSQVNNTTLLAWDEVEIATFAGGCFWCTERDFERLNGIYAVISGYAGGGTFAPIYEDVAAGKTNHREAVQVIFNPKVISYRDLVDYHWRHFDPTDGTGSFVDRGFQYSGAVYCHSAWQCEIAERSKEDLVALQKFENPIVAPIVPFSTFYSAENYHQDYYLKQPFKYKYYRNASGRDKFLESIWGTKK